VQQNETNTKQDEAEWDEINGRKKLNYFSRNFDFSNGKRR